MSIDESLVPEVTSGTAAALGALEAAASCTGQLLSKPIGQNLDASPLEPSCITVHEDLGCAPRIRNAIDLARFVQS